VTDYASAILTDVPACVIVSALSAAESAAAAIWARYAALSRRINTS